MKKVLIVEDEIDVLEILGEFFRLMHFGVQKAVDGEEALEALKEGPFHLYVLDVRLPKIDGFELANRIREKDPQTPIIFLTGLINSETQAKVEGISKAYYLRKPVTFEKLQEILQKLGVLNET
ncbi:MAG: response regulator [Thermodesulfobacteria bacterium]|nr:response regulator [Thermodesulfobacteriota bacterium]